MSTKAEQTMFNSLARRLPLEQKADTPTNSQAKQLHLCEDAGSADFEAAKLSMGQIEGGESNYIPKGKPCCDD